MLRLLEKHCQRLFRVIAGHRIFASETFSEPPNSMDGMQNAQAHKALSQLHFPVRRNLFATAFIRYYGCDSMATDQPPWSFR